MNEDSARAMVHSGTEHQEPELREPPEQSRVGWADLLEKEDSEEQDSQQEARQTAAGESESSNQWETGSEGTGSGQEQRSSPGSAEDGWQTQETRCRRRARGAGQTEQQPEEPEPEVRPAVRAQEETAEGSQNGEGSGEQGGGAAESPEVQRGLRQKTWHRERQLRQNQARALGKKKKREEEDFAFREAMAIKQAQWDLAVALGKVLTADADATSLRLHRRLAELGFDTERAVAEMAREALAAGPG